VSAALGNYVSDNPSDLGNFMSADTVQLMALDETGGEMINVTVAGAPPKVTVGQFARVVELEAIPWATNGRNGTAFRARSIEAMSAAKAA
jgi:hypothetical protein